MIMSVFHKCHISFVYIYYKITSVCVRTRHLFRSELDPLDGGHCRLHPTSFDQKMGKEPAVLGDLLRLFMGFSCLSVVTHICGGETLR